ncbi:MAG: hypothetical protein JO062_11885 [Bryobacterales bacterium]|nr:hypothetical protein [Bryobacterales bacterium]
MSLITPALPPAILRAFNMGLGDFVSPKDPLWAVMLKKFIALEVYSLNLDHFIARVPAGAIPPSSLEGLIDSAGWHFLASDGHVYGACHVGSFDPSLPPKLTGFSREAEVLTSIESFDDLNTMDQLRNCIFEPRVLRLPWARFEAFWLHLPDQMAQPAGCNDWIVPYTGFVETPPKYLDDDHTSMLQLGRPFGIAAFLGALRRYIGDHSGRVGNRRSHGRTAGPPPPRPGHFFPRVKRP